MTSSWAQPFISQFTQAMSNEHMKTLQYWPFLGNHLWLVGYSHKVPVIQNVFPCHDIIMVENYLVHGERNIYFCMMMSSNGNIFHVTGPLWGDFTGDQWIPVTKASDVELWCFLWSASEQKLSKQPRRWWFEMPSHPLWCHCNGMALLSQILTTNYPIANKWNCLCQVQSLIKFLKLLHSILQYHIILHCVLMRGFNIICVYIHTCWVHTSPNLAFYWWSSHVYGISLDHLTDVYWIQSH